MTYSQNPPSSCLPATEKSWALAPRIALVERVTRSAPCTVSPSVNWRTLPRTTFAAVAHAHCFPNQPSGKGGDVITRARGSPAAASRAIDTVASVELSSTTISSRFGYVVERIDDTQRAMLWASLRAGTITDTSGGFSSGIPLSSSSEREWRSRKYVTSGGTIHGSEK